MMEPTPQFVDPNARDYRTYHDQLKQYNLSLQRRVVSAATECLGTDGQRGYAFTSTGSDGRLEKGPQSKIEVVVYEADSGAQDLAKVQAFIKDKFGDVFSTPEIKRIGHQSISCFEGDEHNCYPTRVLDSKFLYGNPALLQDALTQLACEFQLSTGKRLADRFYEKVRRAKKVTRTGKDTFKGTDIVNFDLDSETAYYDCENSNRVFRGSFKYGPLRTVQYGLANEIVKKLRTGQLTADFLSNMPQNITERLFFLEAEGRTKTSHTALDELSDAYKYFLWLYHRSQEAWRVDRQNTIGFDAKEVKPRLDTIIRIMDDGVLN